MFHIRTVERERNKAFTRMQEDTISALGVPEVQARLGANGANLRKLVANAVLVTAKNGELVVPKRQRSSIGPFVVMIHDEDYGTVDISPVTNLYAERRGSPPIPPHPISLEFFRPKYNEQVQGGFISTSAIIPSKTLIGDHIRITPAIEGPVIMNSLDPGASSVTLAHETDHFSFVQEDRCIEPRSLLTETTAMELRAHATSYAIYKSRNAIHEVDIDDIKELHDSGGNFQTVGDTLFHRIKGAYGGVTIPQFAGQYTTCVREISGSSSIDPTELEERLMVIGDLVPNIGENGQTLIIQ